MSLYNSFDRSKLLGELNSPDIGTATGTITPAQKKRTAVTNLGLTAGATLSTLTVAVVNVTATLTAAQLLAGVITTTAAAAVNATLPLATAMETAMIAQFGTLAVGDSFTFDVNNQVAAANSFTILTNTGWTLVANNSMAVGPASAGTFRVVRTAANTFSLYRL